MTLDDLPDDDKRVLIASFFFEDENRVHSRWNEFENACNCGRSITLTDAEQWVRYWITVSKII